MSQTAMVSASGLLRAVVVSGIGLTATWGGLFLWYRMPGGPVASVLAVAVWAAGAVPAIYCATTGRWPWVAGYAVVLAGIVAWNASLVPRNDRDWAADVARPLSATLAADHVAIHDARNFAWRTETEFTPRWEERRFRLDTLRSVDLINSYWSGPAIAHTLISFGFADGRYLAFSVEIRRERGETYSNLAGFFKQYEVVAVAADERDIVRLRSNVRREDVRLFRLKVTPDQARAGFLELLRRANAIAAEPAFYDSLRTNCTTAMFGAARTVAPDLPFDWRIILSGYLPDYAYEQGLLDRRYDLATLRERGRIADRALAADEDPDFSARIREGVPDPNAPATATPR